MANKVDILLQQLIDTIEQHMSEEKIDRAEIHTRLRTIEDKLGFYSATLHTLKFVVTGVIVFVTIKFGDIKAFFK